MEGFGETLKRQVVCTGESRKDEIGKPDYAILVNNLLAGYVELKEPGKGANPKSFKGHDKRSVGTF